MRAGIIAAALIFTSCVDPFSTRVHEDTSRYVVEGRITNQGPGDYVTISKSANYTNDIDGINRFVSQAEVRVCDEAGNCIHFYEFSKGHYQPVEGAPRGTAGKTYYVSITLSDGSRIASTPQELKESPPISRVYYEYNPETLTQDGFTVYVDTDDPADERNYYKWETINYFPYSPLCFHKLPLIYPPIISSDKNINGNRISRQQVRTVPFDNYTYYVVEVYQLALTAQGYAYLNEINKQVNSRGSIFDPPPSYIRGNLFNPDDADDNVLGYFLVAGVSRKDLVVDRSTTGITPKVLVPVEPIPSICWPPPCPDYICGGVCTPPPCPPDCATLPGVVAVAPDAWPLFFDPCGY